MIPLLLLLVLSFVVTDNSQTTTVILVRHAEKQTGSDPELTEEGRKRAELLARMMKDAGIKAIYASEYKRTLHTVEPLAKQLNLDIERYPAANSQALIDRVLKAHKGDTVLIAAHSNTIPELVRILGVKVALDIPDSDYSGIYLVTVSSSPSLTVLRYGN